MPFIALCAKQVYLIKCYLEDTMDYLKINSNYATIRVAQVNYIDNPNHIEFMFRIANKDDSYNAYHTSKINSDIIISYYLKQAAESRPLLIDRNKKPFDAYEEYKEPGEEPENEVETENPEDQRYTNISDDEYYKGLKEINELRGIKMTDKLVSNLETGEYFIAQNLKEDANGTMYYELLGENGPKKVPVSDFRTDYMFAEVTQPGEEKDKQYVDEGQSVQEIKDRIRMLNSDKLEGESTSSEKEGPIDVEPEVFQKMYYDIYEDIDSDWSAAAKKILSDLFTKRKTPENISSDIIEKIKKAFKSMLASKAEEYGIPLNAFIKFIKDFNLPLDFSAQPYDDSDSSDEFFTKLYGQIKAAVDRHISEGKRISTDKLNNVIVNALDKHKQTLAQFHQFLKTKNLYDSIYGKTASAHVDRIVNSIIASIF